MEYYAFKSELTQVEVCTYYAFRKSLKIRFLQLSISILEDTSNDK